MRERWMKEGGLRSPVVEGRIEVEGVTALAQRRSYGLSIKRGATNGFGLLPL
ncbi:hypothetical protein ACVIDN_004573 [Rhizobium brockwellii]